MKESKFEISNVTPSSGKVQVLENQSLLQSFNSFLNEQKTYFF